MDTPPSKNSAPRLRQADRHQLGFRIASYDALVAPDHPVRAVWDFAERADLSPLLDRIRAVEGAPGHPATDPRILLALWIYATIDGVGSARELSRLCREHQVYQWICGGISVNHHLLADFRVGDPDVLEQLMVRGVAALTSQDLVSLDRIAQDGMRVRASAGAASFRRRRSLEEHLHEARSRVEGLGRQLEEDPASCTKRQGAARARADRERQERIERALEEMEQLEERKKSKDPNSENRVSTTDPEARVMKMPDGGFRPAFNVQFATDTASQVVVGVQVGNLGSDLGRMAEMIDKIRDSYGRSPREILVDGGFTRLSDIDHVSTVPHESKVYAPVMKPRKVNRDPHVPRPNDSPAVAAWRIRMGTDEAKVIYRQRAQTAECVNAIARNRGLTRFLVRGLERVRAVALWFALAHNVWRARSLQPAL